MHIAEYLSYGFVQRALVAGTLLAACSALCGVFLVLRRLSLIADSLGHVSFAGVALGLALKTSPVYFTIPVAAASSLGILALTKKAKVYGDAALGMAGAAGIAAGAAIASLSGGFNVDLLGYLFGSLLAVSGQEVWAIAAATAALFALAALFYNELVCVTFNPDLARVSGVNVKAADAVFVTAAAVGIVLALRVAGVMLVSALVIIPPVCALEFKRGFKATIAIACACSVFSVIGGIFVSLLADVPPGAASVLISLAVFAAVKAVRFAGKRGGS